MTHPSFRPLLSDIKSLESRYLIEQVQVLGGLYVWPDHQGPIVLAETDDMAEVLAVEAVEYVESEKSVSIRGHWRNEWGRIPQDHILAEVWPENLPVGEITTILDMLSTITQ